MPRFAQKKFVITGGSSGIGLATAQRIAAEGGEVLVSGRDSDRLRAAVDGTAGLHTFAGDAASPDDAARLADETQRLFGEIDGVFLNAGTGAQSPLGSITLENFRSVFELNVAGVLFGAQALSPLVRGGGSLLLMGSGAKTKGIPGIALYAGSKGAVRSITLVLARELSPRGIRVNTISPGPIDTPFHSKDQSPEEIQQFADFMKTAIPMGRFGRVEEAAAVASFLLSDEASFVTGADYPVDGGEAQL